MKARLINLMKLLVEENDIITVSQIAERLRVSKKTVRNDLYSCKSYFDEMGITLVKKSGVGVYIEASEEKKLETLNRLKRETIGFIEYGSIERHLIILKRLLFNKKKISSQWLERNLYVSRASVYKDLEAVEKWLSDRDIILTKDKYGRFELKGGEKRTRKAIFDWFFFCKKSLNKADAEEMVKDTVLGSKYAHQRAERVARKIEEIFEIKLVPEDFNGLVYKLNISLNRMQEGYYVTLKKATLDRLTSLKLYEVIDVVANFIKRDYYVLLPESEKGYLLGLVVSLKTYEGPDNWNVDESFIQVNREITDLIVESIFASINVLDRERVYKIILGRVQTLVNQINYGLYSYHPIADKVFNNYHKLCTLVKSFIPIFREKMNYRLTISDLSEWLILMALLVEQSKRPLKAVFVYSHKYADAKLSIEVLKNNFNQVDIVKVIPVDSFEEKDCKNIELIFIDDAEQEVFTPLKKIFVPPLLSFQDKMKIYYSISRYHEEVNYYLISLGED